MPAAALPVVPSPARALARRARRWIAATALLALAGCATAPPSPPAPTLALELDPARSRVWLLGEVHDNAAQHALRRAALERLLARGARPALVMEQFDREQQATLDRLREQARAAGRTLDAQALIDAAVPAGGGGWDWDFYRPYVQLALDHGLPLLAANVSRGEARQVIARGLAASGFDAAVPEDLLAGQAAAIVASHCGQVDSAFGRRMAAAQVARDQAMAALVAQWRTTGVVLLAGNGHVRRDLGVTRWLPADLAREAVAVGLLERPAPGTAGSSTAEDDATGAYDLRVFTERQPRPDPCEGLRMPAAPRPG